MSLDFSVVVDNIPLFGRALLTTITISALAFVISASLGMVGLAFRLSERPALRLPTIAFIEFFRNVPLIVVLYVVYYGIPNNGLTSSGYASGAIALILNSTAYMIEIFRTGAAAIEPGQREAGEALGLSARQLWIKVILPQALIVSYPAIGNQLVQVVLGSSLVMLLGVNDITFAAYQLGSITFRYFELFIFAAIVYVLTSRIIGLAWTRVGRLMIKGYREATSVR